jgi:hypothetical protein
LSTRPRTWTGCPLGGETTVRSSRRCSTARSVMALNDQPRTPHTSTRHERQHRPLAPPQPRTSTISTHSRHNRHPTHAALSRDPSQLPRRYSFLQTPPTK